MDIVDMLKELSAYRFQGHTTLREAADEIARLRAELEAARVDAERLDFFDGLSGPQKYYIAATAGTMPIRAAIDAARGGK